ncbi:MAG TPA: cytochrome c biogenesis protein CcdA [Gemmatimonadota bacterium]|nr:cytochrome c biogenesis protein CcdA [Gemmatimonadota bacterium]
MGGELSLAVAFGAGVVSFLSPCVLPLFPSYLSFITGLTFDELSAPGTDARPRVRRLTILHSLLFILGFMLVFVALGASATALGQFLRSNQVWIRRVAGLVIVLFGLHITGLLNFAFLRRERRVHLQERPEGMLGSVVVGVAFGAGWTPCIGPILGAILTMAGSSGELRTGVGLLVVYGLGLGLPFFVAALGFNAFLTAFRRVRTWLRPIEIASGLVLVAVGLLIFTNYFAVLAAYLNRWLLPLFPFIAENI